MAEVGRVGLVAKLKEKEGQEATWKCSVVLLPVSGFIWKVCQPWLHKLRIAQLIIKLTRWTATNISSSLPSPSPHSTTSLCPNPSTKNPLFPKPKPPSLCLKIGSQGAALRSSSPSSSCWLRGTNGRSGCGLRRRISGCWSWWAPRMWPGGRSSSICPKGLRKCVIAGTGDCWLRPGSVGHPRTRAGCGSW